jgi:hypothetical protein
MHHKLQAEEKMTGDEAYVKACARMNRADRQSHREFSDGCRTQPLGVDDDIARESRAKIKKGSTVRHLSPVKKQATDFVHRANTV